MSPGFDELTTAAATRRGTLALGSAALLGLIQARGATAGKGNKSCKKTSRRKVDEACGRQSDECNAFFTPLCAGTADPEQCRAAVAGCCSFLNACDFTGHATCVAAQLQP